MAPTMEQSESRRDSIIRLVCYLDVLPTELLQNVCSHLGRQSLKCFSLASKRCYAAALVHLFDTIAINVLTEAALWLEIQQWIRLLERTSKFASVRTLKIDDGIECADHPRVASYTLQHYQYETCWSKEAGKMTNDLCTWSEEHRRPVSGVCLNTGMKEHHDWSQLAQFIQMLPALDHIVYNRAERIPLELWAAIRQRPQQLRLDMRSIHAYRSPYSSLRISEIIPLLTSFSLRFPASCKEPTNFQHAIIALLDQVLQSAPKLKRVGLYWSSRDNLPSMSDYMTRPDLTSQIDLPYRYDSRPKSVSLRHLTVRFESRRNEPITDLFEFWKQRVDVKRLKSLKLEITILARVPLPPLHGLLELEDIETLVFSCGWAQSSLSRVFLQIGWGSTVCDMLENLKPLARLRLSGYITTSDLEAVGDRHGPSLRQLWLFDQYFHKGDAFNLRCIRQLCHQFARLEELRLPLQRSRGNHREYRSYKCLGSIRSLRRLDIYMQITNRDRYTHKVASSYDEFDRLPYYHKARRSRTDMLRGYVREILINCAIDGDLARAIFDVVANGRPSTDRPLECLVITPHTGFLPNTIPRDHAFQAACRALARAWSVVRDERDTHRDRLIVKPLTPAADINSCIRPDMEAGRALSSVLWRLWPPTERNADGGWKFWWRSFPLRMEKGAVRHDDVRRRNP